MDEWHSPALAAHAHSIRFDQGRSGECVRTLGWANVAVGAAALWNRNALTEGLRLRVKDVDADRQGIIVRQAKSDTSPVAIQPRSLAAALRQ